MKTRIYLRIGKTNRGSKVHASTKPNFEALMQGTPQYGGTPIPTVMVAVDLEISDREFEATRILLQQKIESVAPAVTLKQAKTSGGNNNDRNKDG